MTPVSAAHVPAVGASRFKGYVRTWQAARAITKPLKPRTVVENRRLFENEIFPTFGHSLVTAITVEDVDRWWAKLLKKHPTRHKRNRDAYGLLKQAMGALVASRSGLLRVPVPARLRQEVAAVHRDDIAADELSTRLMGAALEPTHQRDATSQVHGVRVGGHSPILRLSGPAVT